MYNIYTVKRELDEYEQEKGTKMDEEMNVSELLVEQTKENQTKTILLMIEELERETKDENRKEVLADVRERIKTLLK